MNTIEKKAIYRDLHDGISPVNQAVVDGSLTKDVDRNVEMSVLLDRKDSAGSSYSPLYWVERMYQALTARLFSNPQEAYDSTIIQAKHKGLSEDQDREIRKWLASMGFAVKGADEDLEQRPLVDNGGYSVIDYKQKQRAAGLSVANHAVASLNTIYCQETAITKLGEVLAAYNAAKPKWQAKIRIAELRKAGYGDREIFVAATKEALPSELVASELLVTRTASAKTACKFRITIENAAGQTDIHYVVEEDAAKAKAAVKDLYDKDAKIGDCDEMDSGPEHSEAEKNTAVVKKASRKERVALRKTPFGTARALVAHGVVGAELVGALEEAFPDTEHSRELQASAMEAVALKDVPLAMPSDSSDPFLAFYRAECCVSEEQALDELRKLDACVRQSMDRAFRINRLGQLVPPPPAVPVTPGKKRVYDEKQKGWIEVPDQPGS